MRKMTLAKFLFMGILGLSVFLPLKAQVDLPPDFHMEVVFDELEKPVGITFDTRGRMYYWTKAGKVFFVENGTPTLLLDISEEVADIGDNGLTGFVLHPDFYQNSYIYLLYTVDRYHLDYYGTPGYRSDITHLYEPTIGRVTRFTADPSSGFRRIVEGSRKVLIGKEKKDGIPILDTAHGTGDLEFGRDGSLLVATGDGSAWRNGYVGGGPPFFESFEEKGLSEGFIPPEHDVGSYRAQLLRSLNGKVLRIDAKTGLGIASNPYYDASDSDAAISKVWALGLRMPFRMCIRPETGSQNPAEGKPGSIFLGDVSGGVWEEINVIRLPGYNYGWPIYDALEFNPIFYALKRANFLAPNPLFGAGGCEKEFFTFHELLTGLTLPPPTLPNPCDSTQQIPDIQRWNLHPAPAVSWLHTYRNGELTTPTLTYPLFDQNGTQKMVPVDGNQTKVIGAPFWGNAVTGTAFYEAESFPETYRGSFFASDFDGWIRNFVFDKNDSLVEVRDFYSDTTEVVDVAINNDDGCLYFIQYPGKIARICYGGNVPPVAVARADTFYGPSPLTVQFSGDDSYDPQQQPILFHWDFGDGHSSEELNPSYTFSAPGISPKGFEVTLTVTDSLGAESKAKLSVSLNNTPPKARIISFSDGDLYPMGGPTWQPLQAEVSDAEYGAEALSYAWTTYLHHNTHFHLEGVDSLPETHTLITSEGCGNEPFWYRIGLEVRDKAGLSTYVEAEMYPDCVDPFGEVETMTLKQEGAEVGIYWSAREEGDIAFYELQRSPDPNHFLPIDTFHSQGVSGGAVASYAYSTTALNEGLTYFRLRVVAGSGHSYYTPATFTIFITEGVRLFPNPSSGILLVEIQEARGPVSLTLFNHLGQPVFTESWQAQGPDIRRLDIYELEDAVYPYRLDLGYHSITGKLLKITP